MKHVNQILMNALFLLGVAFMTLLVGCEPNEDTDIMALETDAYAELRTLPMGDGEIQAAHHFKRSLGGKCAELVYPVTVIFPDNSTAIVASNEELRASVRAWYEANDSDQKPTLDYPVDLLVDGTVVTANDQAELLAYFADCRPQRPGSDRPGSDRPRPGKLSWIKLLDGDCFDVDFPITINFPDGTSQLVNDAESLIAALRDYKQNGPDSLGRPELAFPISVSVNDSAFDVNSLQELNQAARLCVDRPDRKPCLVIQFPVTLQFPDSTTLVVNNEDELKAAIEDWLDNGTVDGRPSFVFPIDVAFKGEIITVESPRQLQRLKRACKGQGRPGKDRPGDGRPGGERPDDN